MEHIFDFNTIAATYDSWYDSKNGKLCDKLEKQAFDKLLKDIDNGKTILEFGCGTGHWSSYFSLKGFSVTGIDISEQMIRIAQNKKIPSSRFEIADCENVPFDNDSFDVAAAITVLEFTDDIEKVIAEMVRCIKKKNGILLIGMLNAASRYNQRRKNKKTSVYQYANFLTPQQLTRLLDKYGKIQIITTGFLPDRNWIYPVWALWNKIGKLMRPNKGFFIAARVDLR